MQKTLKKEIKKATTQPNSLLNSPKILEVRNKSPEDKLKERKESVMKFKQANHQRF